MNVSESGEETSREQVGRETVSVRLVRAREAKGLSQKEVADELFLTTTFIRYIDDGEFEKIPKPAFIKGYLRSYARVVGLTGDEIVEAFEQEQDIAPQAPRVVDVTERASPPPGGIGSPIIQTGLIGLILLLLVGAGVWFVASDDESPPVVTSAREAPRETPAPDMREEDPTAAERVTPSPVTAPPMPDGEESTPAGVDAEGTLQADPTALTVAPTEGPAPISTEPGTAAGVEASEGNELAVERVAAAESAPATDDAGVDDPSDVQIERIREGDTNYITVYAGGEAEMGFRFTDECWVEITDANDVRIYADLNREGDVMTVYGDAPFDVLLGRAPAVRMTLDGQSIDISRFMTRDETARVRTARL